MIDPLKLLRVNLKTSVSICNILSQRAVRFLDTNTIEEHIIVISQAEDIQGASRGHGQTITSIFVLLLSERDISRVVNLELVLIY